MILNYYKKTVIYFFLFSSLQFMCYLINIMNDSKPYIYVIEDEESLSKLICLYLEKSEMTAKAFYKAEDALTALHEDKVPDIILLDLNLPGLSGFDFLKKLKENKDLSPTVIITSARDSDEDIIKGLEYADDFITKPFSPNVLIARVKAAIRRQLSANAKAEESIQFGDYTLLLNSCVLKKGVAKIPRNPGQSLSDCPEGLQMNHLQGQKGRGDFASQKEALLPQDLQDSLFRKRI